jgi:hypothetical protein
VKFLVDANMLFLTTQTSERCWRFGDSASRRSF